MKTFVQFQSGSEVFWGSRKDLNAAQLIANAKTQWPAVKVLAIVYKEVV